MDMDIQTVLVKATEARQGNKPKFDEGHVIMSIIYIDELQPIGRITLMKKMELHEASMKTLLKRLKELNIITTDPIGGNTLTEIGKRIASCIKNNSIIKTTFLKSLHWNSTMIVIRKGSEILEIIPVLKLRDEIIRLGVEKVLICTYINGKIENPPKTEEMSLKGLLEEIKENCSNCSENDMIIFITPNDIHLAYLVLAYLFKVLKRC